MLDPSERAALRQKQRLLFDTGHLSVRGSGRRRSRWADVVGIAVLLIAITAITALVTYWLA